MELMECIPAPSPLQNAYVSGRRADAEHVFLNGNFSRDNRGRIAYKYVVSAAHGLCSVSMPERK